MPFFLCVFGPKSCCIFLYNHSVRRKRLSMSFYSFHSSERLPRYVDSIYWFKISFRIDDWLRFHWKDGKTAAKGNKKYITAVPWKRLYFSFNAYGSLHMNGQDLLSRNIHAHILRGTYEMYDLNILFVYPLNHWCLASKIPFYTSVRVCVYDRNNISQISVKMENSFSFYKIADF